MAASAPEDMVEFPCDVERLPNGNTLIADGGDEAGSGSEVIEVNPRGEIVWAYATGLAFAHSAKRLPNGNTLISDTTNNRVIEVTPGGKVAFDSDWWSSGTGRLSDGSYLHYPNDAHALDGGRLLITDRNNDRFVVVGRDGTVARSFHGSLRHPHNADPLPNGNVILADSDGNRVVEIAPDDREVWCYDGSNAGGLAWPRDADRLADGNTLVGDSKHHRVLEVSPDGRVVWQYEMGHFANVYDADRLANGNTLISDQQHHEVIEVERAGRIVWRFSNYRRVRPVFDRLFNPEFKEAEGEGTPIGWTLATRLSEGGGRVIWRDDGGGRYPGLEFDRPGALSLQQTVAVRPGRLYHLSGRVRAEDVEGVACVQIAFLDDADGLVEDVTRCPKGQVLVDTTDWMSDEVEAVAPANAVAADIRLFITGPGRVFANELRFFG